VTILGIGAPFWGVLLGCVVAHTIERERKLML
jgi:predicted benzoate:H+ symporter BenE